MFENRKIGTGRPKNKIMANMKNCKLVKNELEKLHEHMNTLNKMLPFDQQRRQTSGILEKVGDNIDEICDRIVTVDETWFEQYDPESKQESMQWTKKRKARRNSRFKVIEAYGDNFWDSEGTRQSYRSDMRSYRAECCFKDNASVNGAGFEAGLRTRASRKLTTHLQPRSSSQ
ncbi:hypothetical protein EVAR_34617_1 [Eumeta japonica]|uniref:Uncharacterized protein n=1 Tax=Eumeta variegata TaxID=151549 RepID=A0A4C1VGJ3_EUMVA|nr:hypothetical protein EVAR_34617_1 [Eumeta japonica]